MAEFFDAITGKQRAFIASQSMFFVATAAADGRINLSPKGQGSFRVLGDNLVGYMDGGSGDETQAHLTAGGRITLMFCAVDQPSLILRLYGRGRAVLPQDDEWDMVAKPFDMPSGSQSIILVNVERVEEEAAAPVTRPDEAQAPPVEIERPWVHAVLQHWLDEIGPEGWFDSSAEEDARILHLFGPLWQVQQGKPAQAFLGDAEIALAALILFDQFPRNMYRGDARAFATDALALELARAALAKGYDAEFRTPANVLFYLPFMHSEDLADQEHALELFSQQGLENNLRFALAHHDLIARFGRFPHRNKALGRENRPGEEEAIAEGEGW